MIFSFTTEAWSLSLHRSSKVTWYPDRHAHQPSPIKPHVNYVIIPCRHTRCPSVDRGTAAPASHHRHTEPRASPWTQGRRICLLTSPQGCVLRIPCRELPQRPGPRSARSSVLPPLSPCPRKPYKSPAATPRPLALTPHSTCEEVTHRAAEPVWGYQ